MILNSDGYKYLCESCSKYDLCTIRISGTDSEFCKYYETKNNLNTLSNPVSQNNISESLIRNSSKDQPKGICKNCANLDDCMHPKPEAGVWRCEEYE